MRFGVYSPDFAVKCQNGDIIVSRILLTSEGDNLLILVRRVTKAWRAFSFIKSEKLPIEDIKVPR